ncbi:MAG: RNase adapter RapZ [Denitrovibrio sp.]|nr:MAG: RNase adapter RapZ [Denitrovibrio sp.]
MKGFKKSLIVLTGLSGAGKSNAASTLEDIGYFTIDNLPLMLFDKLVDLMHIFENDLHKVALVIDSRSKDIDKVLKHITVLKEKYEAKIVFIHASEEVILKRYKETRRKHPMGENLVEAIAKEAEIMWPVREQSDLSIDTSLLNVHQLKSRIEEAFSEGTDSDMVITVQSFGFKYGLPQDSDLVFDVRFLKNPFFVEELRDFTGKDDKVRDYVFADIAAKKFLKKLKELLGFLIPNYIREGKKFLTISIGCTGGRHRSVANVEFIAGYLEKKTTHKVNIRHRDIDR